VLLLRSTECIQELPNQGITTVSEKSPWIAVYTKSRHEKRVAQSLGQRGFDCYLPLLPAVSRWHDRKRTVWWPLFPGYLFARLTPSNLSALHAVPGVVSVVSVAGVPATIPNAEIENVRRLAEAIALTGSGPKPAVLVTEGESIEVAKGPFRGVQGRVVEHRGDRITLNVGVSAIGQGVRLEVAEECVRSIADHSRSA